MSDNRQTVYSGQIPLSEQYMTMERDFAKGLSQFVLDTVGGSTNAFFTGMGATAHVSGLEIDLTEGALYQYNEIDAVAWSSLTIDASKWMLQGVLPAPLTGSIAKTITLVPPTLT